MTNGDLIDHERRRLTHDEILEEYEMLSRKGEGFTDAQIAARLGIHPVTLDRHLKREQNRVR
jgi:DNA-binding CsgD family transcriptional regulator